MNRTARKIIVAIT